MSNSSSVEPWLAGDHGSFSFGVEMAAEFPHGAGLVAGAQGSAKDGTGEWAGGGVVKRAGFQGDDYCKNKITYATFMKLKY